MLPLPVEMVMRAYVTGVTSTSIWTHYERGVRVFCGHQLPDGLHKACLHDGSSEDLASRIQDLWHLGGLPAGHEEAMSKILHRFDPIPACRSFDERLEELAVAHAIAGGK